jgi:peptidoglycan/LPS O-acetylase OafA/YrhL
MAYMQDWPSGTAHYWTLAIQVQFYLLWPLLVFWLPRRSLPLVFFAAILVGGMFRAGWQELDPAVRHVQALTPTALDYFGAGALLGWLDLNRAGGVAACQRWLRPASVVLLSAYTAIYIPQEMLGVRVPWIGNCQQSLLALGFAALIGTTLGGFRGPLGWLLDHRWVQKVGALSFGLYLFHSCVPLLLGWLLPQLWWPIFEGPLLALRMLVFLAVSWGLAMASHRWLEGNHRSKPTPVQ